MGCLQGLAAPPGPSQVLQTWSSWRHWSPLVQPVVLRAEGVRAPGHASGVAGTELSPGLAGEGLQAPGSICGLLWVAVSVRPYAHLGTAATPACLSPKWASVWSAPGHALAVALTWALQGPLRAASRCGRPGQRALGMGQIVEGTWRCLLPARCGSLGASVAAGSVSFRGLLAPNQRH